MTAPKVRLTKTFKINPPLEYRGEKIDSVLRGSVFYWVDQRDFGKKEAGLVATDEEHPYLCSEKIWIPLSYLEMYDDRLDQIIELLETKKESAVTGARIFINPSTELNEETIAKIAGQRLWDKPNSRFYKKTVDSGEKVEYNGLQTSRAKDSKNATEDVNKVLGFLDGNTVEEVLNVLTQAVKDIRNLGKNTDR